MMRSQKNLKDFGHVAKNKDQKRNYQEFIHGPKFEETTKDDVLATFDDTGDRNAEEVEESTSSPQKPPFRSLNTWWQENKYSVLIIGIVAPIVVSVVLYILFGGIENIITRGEEVEVLKSRMDTTEDSVSKLQDKYESISTENVKQETLLEEVRKDLLDLESLIK